VGVNGVSWVKGSGKEVQWKDSHVTVYEKDSDGKEQSTYLLGRRDGSLILKSGMSMYIAGGQFKEE
jgi:hypothetical protein